MSDLHPGARTWIRINVSPPLSRCSYAGPLQEEGGLTAAVEGGLSSVPFIELCLSLCAELRKLLRLQENVSRPQGWLHDLTVTPFLLLLLLLHHLLLVPSPLPPPPGPEDAESFKLELRAFLQELHCPHPALLEPAGLLATPTDNLKLIGEGVTNNNIIGLQLPAG